MSRRALLASWVLVAAAGAALALPGPVRTFFLEENLHAVVPGQIYRSAQPSGEELAAMIERLGLRAVLNLRGERGGRAWLEEERRTAGERGVVHYTVRLNADRMPPAPRLAEVVRLLDTAPRPLLLHCEGGVERSGLVGAVAMLLAGGDPAVARGEFAASKGFIGFLARSDLPRVLDDYEAWLAARRARHEPDRFRAWVERDYVPYFYRARIEPIDPPPALSLGREAELRFRVTNESPHTIPFRASRERGVHLGAILRTPDAPRGSALELRDGFVDLDLAPGATAELTLRLPPLDRPGTWSLHVDLVDEQVKWFGDMGSPALALGLEAEGPVAGAAGAREAAPAARPVGS
jgi:protein tyrosine phosphatase (PTP) superfamily phosphohydrolase (DUF442 family)